MNAIDQALQLAELARDPVEAMKNQGRVVNLLRRVKAEQSTSTSAAAPAAGTDLTAVLERLERAVSRRARTLDEIGASKIVRVTDVPTLNPGDTTAILRVEWPGGEGYARSLYATTIDGDVASLSRLSVRIMINGSDDIFTNGQAPAFVPMIAFAPSTHAWFRLAGPRGETEGYPVSSLTKWSISFRHEGPTGVPAITPVLLFGYAPKA